MNLELMRDVAYKALATSMVVYEATELMRSMAIHERPITPEQAIRMLAMKVDDKEVLETALGSLKDLAKLLK